MSGRFKVLILHLSISPKIPSPPVCVCVCEAAAATAQWGQMVLGGNGGQAASLAACHHPAATEQQLPSLRPLTRTHTRAPGTRD